VEAQACLHAIQYTIGAGIQKVKIETDCLTLKTALLSKAYDDAQGGNLFREIKYLLEIHFAEFKVLHCPRICNKVAHRLASMGAKLNDGTTLQEKRHSFVGFFMFVRADVHISNYIRQFEN
jgi:ribonuclease HI